MMNKNFIEQKAEQLIINYSVSKGKAALAPIDPIDVIEFLGYSVEYVEGKYDSSVYGALVPQSNTVEINNDVSFNEGMENFTIAHEIGHIVLHLEGLEKNGKSTCDIGGLDSGDSRESEADNFASYLLMPTQMVKDAFYSLRKKPLHIKNSFILSFVLKKTKRLRALKFAGEMIEAGNFTNVSKLAMVNRLIGMGLIKGLQYQKNTQIRRKKQ